MPRARPEPAQIRPNSPGIRPHLGIFNLFGLDLGGCRPDGLLAFIPERFLSNMAYFPGHTLCSLSGWSERPGIRGASQTSGHRSTQCAKPARAPPVGASLPPSRNDLFFRFTPLHGERGEACNVRARASSRGRPAGRQADNGGVGAHKRPRPSPARRWTWGFPTPKWELQSGGALTNAARCGELCRGPGRTGRPQSGAGMVPLPGSPWCDT